MISSSDDLRSEIRARGEADPDPGRVAEQILEHLSDKEAHVVAGITLRDYVRRVLALPHVSADSVDAKPNLQMLDGRKTSSWKVQATQNQRLEAKLSASSYGLHGQWKHYGDCGEADLLVMADSRRSKAKDLASEADHYEMVAGLLREYHVERVRDLPRKVLLHLYGRGAA